MPPPLQENLQSTLEPLAQGLYHSGCPEEVQTDNAPGYIATATQVLLEKWRVRNKTGNPYSPTGQAIVERAHPTFKTLLSKQKRGSQETSPRNLTMLTLYTYNFLNCDDSLKTPVDKHFVQNRPAISHPLVLYKDPLGEGKWEGPAALLTWGRGHACVSGPTGLLWLPAKRVKPYHNTLSAGSAVAVRQDAAARIGVVGMKEQMELRSQGMQTPEGSSQSQPQGVTWGHLNTLNNRAKQVIQQSGVNDTPGNRF